MPNPPPSPALPVIEIKEVPNAFDLRAIRSRAGDVIPESCETGCEYSISDDMQDCIGSPAENADGTAAQRIPRGCRRAAHEKYRLCMQGCGIDVPPAPRVADPNPHIETTGESQP